MSYYGMGDYYMGAGDPGIFSSIAHVVGGVASTVSKILPGPIGSVAGVVGRTLKGTKSSAPTIKVPQMPQVNYATATNGAPAKQRGVKVVTGMTADTTGFRKRRRMNVANPKALRRAIRRESGFVKLARRALKGTGYRVVSSASQRKRYSVKEAGAGSVTIQ